MISSVTSSNAWKFLASWINENQSFITLVALTPSALRLLAHGWMHDDWFTYLKSGLISLPMDQLMPWKIPPLNGVER